MSPSLFRLLALVAVLVAGGILITKLILPETKQRDKISAGEKKAKPKQANKERFLDTSLVRLNLQSFPINKIEPAVQTRQGTIVAVGERILLADRTGRFFEIDMKGDTPGVKPLPVHIDLHEEELLDFAAGRGAVGTYLLRVLKLATLEEGRQLAASYTAWDAETECVNLYVATVDLTDDWSKIDPKGWRVVFKSKPCLKPTLDGTVNLLDGHQAGGRIAEVSPGVLVLVAGDFSYDGLDRSPSYPQDPEADYGKAITIDTKTGVATQFAIGLRNPQGLAIDSKGRLWSVEHGPKGGDELNLLKQGRNYGWPMVTLGTQYFGHTWPQSRSQGRHDGYEQPIFAWLPDIAPGNLIEVKTLSPEWNGDLLIAGLQGSLHRLRLNGDSVVFEETIPIGKRLRDIDQLADGRVVIWTDDGSLLVLTNAGVDTVASVFVEKTLAAFKQQKPEVRVMLRECARCHEWRKRSNADGKITLRGVYGRKVASGDKSLYSEALRRVDGSWSDERLDEFLRDPNAVAPGTAMQFEGIRDDGVRRTVIDFLKALQ